ncbi:MAG: hypothetical protein KatS3mg109_2307 [Pirellulaceae bacterium]|nr:MAG: hypothetical protein KatS3mg109_2307 [Pirellulaceae bacterium]
MPTGLPDKTPRVTRDKTPTAFQVTSRPGQPGCCQPPQAGSTLHEPLLLLLTPNLDKPRFNLEPPQMPLTDTSAPKQAPPATIPNTTIDIGQPSDTSSYNPLSGMPPLHSPRHLDTTTPKTA